MCTNPENQRKTYHTKPKRDIRHAVHYAALVLGAVLGPAPDVRLDHYFVPPRQHPPSFPIPRIQPRSEDLPFDPYRNGWAPFSLIQILWRAPEAMMGRAVMCRRNLPVLVSLPMQVPRLRRASRLMLVARLAMESLT